MIIKNSTGYYVVSMKGRNLGGPYRLKSDAEKRLREIHRFADPKTGAFAVSSKIRTNKKD